MGETTATDRFAEKLRMCREEVGLSQAQLAAELKVSRGSVSFYENADRKPDIEFIASAARFFKVSCDWLLGLTDVKTPDIDKRAICKKTGLTEKAFEKLTSFQVPFVEEKNGLKLFGYQKVPAPPEISEWIESKHFVPFLRSINSMKLVESGGVNNAVAIRLQKLLGKRGLWEFFRQQTMKTVGNMLDDIAPPPSDEDEYTPPHQIFEEIESLGYNEDEYWNDHLSGKTDGKIRDYYGNVIYKNGKLTFYSEEEAKQLAKQREEEENVDAQPEEADSDAQH